MSVMSREQRLKREKLDSILARLDGAERRALSDLRSAGFNFRSIGRARRYKATLATIDRFNQDEDLDALEASLETKTRSTV